jgi:YD repeat-containing protein
LGYVTTASFDLLDRTVARTDALGYMTTTVFDPLGRVQATVDALGRLATSVFDTVGRTVASVNALGCRTSFAYDPRGGQTGTTNARGYQSTTVFDALARRQARVDPLGRRTTTAYDARGSTVQRTDAKAQIETRTYDTLGRYSGSQFADATRVTVGYNPVSQVTQMANQLGAYTYAYDPVGRQVSEIGPSYPSGMPLTSVYDPAGNRTGLTTWRGTQTSTFDARSQLTLLQDIEGGRTTWSYDARQMNSRQQNPNGTSTNISYDGKGQCTTIRHLHPDGTRLDSALYTYDPAGNPLSLDREDGDPYSYQYDNANQLLVQSSPNEGTKTWTYDPAGNRITELSNPGTSIPAISYWTTCTFDAADQEFTEQKTGSVINSSSSSTFTYDLNGNRILEAKISGAVTSFATYAWDPSNRLAVVEDGGYVMTNTYRPDGMRHRKVDSFVTMQMVWDRNDVVAWVDQTGALGEFFSRGAKSVKGYSSPSPTGELFYHCTVLGTMQAYSNPDGTTKERAVLEAWGGNATAMGFDACSFVGDHGYWGENAMSRPLYYVWARWLLAGGPLHRTRAADSRR